MRDELHLMELVDHYLDAAMGAEERTTLEARANSNTELRQLIADQRVLREGVKRLALRGVVVRSAPSAGKGRIGPAITTVTILVVASYAWMNWSGGTESDHAQILEELIPAEATEPMPCDEGSLKESPLQEARPDTIVSRDTQVVIRRIQVPANSTPEARQAITHTAATSDPEAYVISSETQKIVLQNVLTPNGDGHNDRLIVPGGPYVRAAMTIWNARNELVFNQLSADPVWNGALENGQPAPDGNYKCQVTAIDQNGRTHAGLETIWLARRAIGSEVQFVPVPRVQ